MKLFLLLALNGIGEELIVDPCCGSENLSLEAIRHLKSLGCDYREKPLQDEYVYITPQLAAAFRQRAEEMEKEKNGAMVSCINMVTEHFVKSLD